MSKGTAFTRVISYTYGSSSRPHAVTEVDNTDGSITLQVQDVRFNDWNRMSSVWATDENNFYSYSVDYGPDLRRVSSEMHRTYQKLYEKFYWDDYEEKVAGSDTLRYYYLNGADGLEALHIVKTSPNAQPVSQTTKVVTDHLGSITALIDESDYAYIARYDAWGNRENVIPYWFDLTFDRGYTGHEHLDLLGLINMNGRMYDPLLGRFLSPDPYVQAPTDPQNFNRYSYCLNNPLKYTDPDGELFGTITGFFADVIRNIILNRDLSDWDWSRTKMGWEIDKGLFKTDPNKSDRARVWEFISRLTWQLPQTIVGDLFVSSANGLGFVKDVSYGYGMTAVDMGLKDGNAVTIGFYSAGPKGYKADWRDHTFVHEYGHYIQSQQHGPLFLMTVGVPSLQSAILQTDNPDSPRHRNRWFEADASYKGAEYFDKYYGSGNEDYKEDSEDFFDINSFKTGSKSLYDNPRNNKNNYSTYGHPTSGSYHWTDIIINFPLIGIVPWFWYK